MVNNQMTKKKTQMAIQKPPKPPSKRKAIRKTALIPHKALSSSLGMLLCPMNHLKQIEFMCMKKKCLKELCSLCMLEHKQHIDSIFPIGELVEENLKRFGEWNTSQLHQKLNFKQRAALD